MEEIDSIYLGVTAKINGRNYTFLSAKDHKLKIIRNLEAHRYEITEQTGTTHYIEFANVRQATPIRKEYARSRNSK